MSRLLDRPAPTGKANARDCVVAKTIRYVGQDAVRRDLRAFAAAALMTPVTDRRAWQALHSRWQTLAEATQHGAAAAECPELDPLMRACAEGFAKVARVADDDARAALAVRLAAARERLNGYQSAGEPTGVSLGQVHHGGLAPQAGPDPLCKCATRVSQAIRLLPWLLYDVPRSRQDEAIDANGWRFRLLWRIGRGRFERQQRIAFRYVVHA